MKRIGIILYIFITKTKTDKPIQNIDEEFLKKSLAKSILKQDRVLFIIDLRISELYTL
jgi:hypothetical protein